MDLVTEQLKLSQYTWQFLLVLDGHLQFILVAKSACVICLRSPFFSKTEATWLIWATTFTIFRHGWLPF